MSVCVISQPRFFPGLHYLHRMMAADVFVILDTVQFNPRHEENRTRLKSPQGAQWLTVPVRQSSRGQLIRTTRIDDQQPWPRKAVATLNHFYNRAPHYKQYAPEVHQILEAGHTALAELDWASWAPAVRLLGITCRFVNASALPVAGHGPGLLLDICKHLGATVYLSGAFGRDYLDVDAFTAEGIAVRFADYQYPVYPQRFDGFVPFLSYLDMLFNDGLDRTKVLAAGTMLPA